MLFVESGPQFGPRGQHAATNEKKKTADEAEMAGGALMSQKGVGELVKTCRYKCDTMVKLVVCCTLLC